VQCVINRKLEHECSDYKEKCSSSAENGMLYKSEFYDDISGEMEFLCVFVDLWARISMKFLITRGLSLCIILFNS
jgi:hypothetical protein